MNSPIRQIGVELFIGVAACTAAYVFMVQPLHRRVAETSAKNGDLQAQIQRDSSQALPKQQIDAMREEAAERSKSVAARSAFAADENATFGSLMALASRHGVRVEQLQPGTARTQKAKPAPVAPSPASAPGTPGGPMNPETAAAPVKDRRSAVSMTVLGEYGRVAAFVRSLECEMGFATVRTVRLTPMMDGTSQRVHASIETEHVWIDSGRGAIAGVENRP